MFARLTGLIAAAHTPMHADGSLNLSVVEQQAEHLGRAGVRGVFVAGSTGESHSLTAEERLTLTRRWAEVGRGCGLVVLVHAGHNCQADAITLAAGARTAGADGVAAVAPSYFKPALVEVLVDFLAPIAAAAAPLPFYYYDIPVLTGITLDMPEFLRRAPERIANFAGLKFTNSDLVGLQECLAPGRHDVLFGYDEMLLAAVALGVRGAVGSTYNFAAPIYQGVLGAVEAGDWPAARAEQLKSVRLIRLLGRFGFSAASKAVMSFLGIDCGPVRPPLRPLTEAEQRDLRDQLEATGLLAEMKQPAR